jgi:hypothetical protein
MSTEGIDHLNKNAHPKLSWKNRFSGGWIQMTPIVLPLLLSLE